MRPIRHAITVVLLALAQGALAQPIITDPILSENAVKQLSPHVYVIVGFPAIEIIVGDRATLVVDTGVGVRNGKLITRVARNLSTHGQRLYLTTTQYHPDRTSGQAGFPADATVLRNKVQQAEFDAEGVHAIAEFATHSPQMKALLEGVTVAQADILFDRELDLDLGGVHARLLYFGPAHTQGDEITFVPEEAVLIPGDVVQNKISPNPACSRCNPRQYLAVLDQVASLHPKLVIPSHGGFGGEELITQERDFLLDVQNSANRLKAQGKTAADAAKLLNQEFAVKYAGWQMLGNNVPALVQHAYEEQP